MDPVKFRSWIASRQGLQAANGSRYRSAREALAAAGWQRSVGGVTPYLAILARSGESRETIDSMAASLEIFELPAVRGCTYVVPAEHFALALAAGRGSGSGTEMAVARKLGVTDDEIAKLSEVVVAALKTGPRAPADLRVDLGDMVRSLGEEGKKKGLTTTLPVALGQLQANGRIRRKPVSGRFDTQRYEYELWDEPVTNLVDDSDVPAALATLYFSWIGAATVNEFREFAGFTLKVAKPACETIGLSRFGDDYDLLALPGAFVEYESHEPPKEPNYRLVGSMDSHLLLRRGASFWLDAEDAEQTAPTGKGMLQVGSLAELSSHAILDRGRLVGLWEFDADAGVIEWLTWSKPDEALLAEIATMESTIREDFGDARSFSLDSPASRRSNLQRLRELRVKAFG